jgi:Flp pilus assembly protein TadD
MAKEREAIRLYPNMLLAHSTLAAAMASKDDWDGALKEYREAVSLDSDDAGAHDGLGLALGNKGDLQGALQEYRKACALDPGNDSYKSDLDDLQETITFQAGADLLDKKDYDGAIVKFREVLRSDPGMVPAHEQLATALAFKSDWAVALKEYREALRLDPDAAYDHHGAGVALESMGDQQGALEEYSKACALDPKDAEYKRHYDSLQERMKPQPAVPPPEVRPIDEALRKAAGSGDLEQVLKLLDEGAGIDATNKQGETALMWAAYWGQSEVVDALIKKGANVNAKTDLTSEDNGNTVLIFSVNSAVAAEGSWDTVVKNSKGDLPAWERNHLEVVKLLVAAGADATAGNLFGSSPIDMAFLRAGGEFGNRYAPDFLEVLMGGVLPPPPQEIH